MELLAVWRKEYTLNKTVCRFVGVGVFALLTALSGFVRIPLPFSPVPVTLQTFFVLLSGACLGKRRGAYAQAGFIGLGVAGLPVFTGAGSGLLYLTGPTAGYLAGFVVASLLTGMFIGAAGTRLWKTCALFLFADALLLFSGTLWLQCITGVSFAHAVSIGFVPFIAVDSVKCVIAALVFRRIQSRTSKLFS